MQSGDTGRGLRCWNRDIGRKESIRCTPGLAGCLRWWKRILECRGRQMDWRPGSRRPISVDTRLRFWQAELFVSLGAIYRAIYPTAVRTVTVIIPGNKHFALAHICPTYSHTPLETPFHQLDVDSISDLLHLCSLLILYIVQAPMLR